MRVEPCSDYVTIISTIASVYLRNRMERDSGWSEKLRPFFQFQDESHAGNGYSEWPRSKGKSLPGNI